MLWVICSTLMTRKPSFNSAQMTTEGLFEFAAQLFLFSPFLPTTEIYDHFLGFLPFLLRSTIFSLHFFPYFFCLPTENAGRKMCNGIWRRKSFFSILKIFWSLEEGEVIWRSPVSICTFIIIWTIQPFLKLNWEILWMEASFSDICQVFL